MPRRSAPRRKRRKAPVKKRATPDKAPGPFARYWTPIWRYTVAGLLVWTPLIITLWVFWWIAKNLGLGIEGLIQGVVRQLNEIGESQSALGFLTRIDYKPGLGFISALALFFATGFLTRYLLGRKLIAFGERLVERIPLISRMYRAVQQIRDVFMARQSATFGRVCVIEYPRRGIYGLAFLTSEEQSVIQDAVGRELHAVFLPTTPNPTSGYLLYLPPSQITELDISIEDAMKIIISGGLYLPAGLTGEAGESQETPQ